MPAAGKDTTRHNRNFALDVVGAVCKFGPDATMMATTTREFKILNKLGIHARPAAQFVKTASGFGCEIRVEKDGEEVDGKSIMGLMMLAAGHGSVITVTAEGADAEAALSAIERLVARKFEEE